MSHYTKHVAKNRKAFFDYEILDRFESGIVLKGTEIKSIRGGKFNLGDSFCLIGDDLQVDLMQFHIAPYDFGNRFNHDPLRKKKLLLKKSEIRRLRAKVNEKGLTLIPLSLYFKKNYLKLSIGLCKGKKIYDKRETLKRKSQQKEIDQAIKTMPS